MDFQTLKANIIFDFKREYGEANITNILQMIVYGIGFKYVIWQRLCVYFKTKKMAFLPIFLVCLLMRRRYMFKFGISIDRNTELGPGLYINHFGGIVVGGSVRIGKNCYLCQGVTIGRDFQQGIEKKGPIIGDDVFIGAGAKIIGNVIVGNNVFIGANAVVVDNIPDNCIAVGVPAKIIAKPN
jgi:serine O-acetyltransferase